MPARAFFTIVDEPGKDGFLATLGPIGWRIILMKINLFSLFRKNNELKDEFPFVEFSALQKGGIYILHLFL